MSYNKSSPIGIFDSGIGGLIVAKEVAKFLPYEDIIYFGDTANFPWGDKDLETIASNLVNIINFLQQKNCKAIIIACHTASSMINNHIFKKTSNKLLLLNVIDAIAIQLKINSKLFKKIGIIGTNQTVNSGKYQTILRNEFSFLNVQSLATPLLAPLIESGKINLLSTNLIVSNYLSNNKMQNLDALILGCTHYNFLYDTIQKLLPAKTIIIEPTNIIARNLKNKLQTVNLLQNAKERLAKYNFYLSAPNKNFTKIANNLFPSNNLKILNLNTIVNF